MYYRSTFRKKSQKNIEKGIFLKKKLQKISIEKKLLLILQFEIISKTIDYNETI